jgi:hypothetical protein
MSALTTQHLPWNTHKLTSLLAVAAPRRAARTSCCPHDFAISGSIEAAEAAVLMYHRERTNGLTYPFYSSILLSLLYFSSAFRIPFVYFSFVYLLSLSLFLFLFPGLFYHFLLFLFLIF